MQIRCMTWRAGLLALGFALGCGEGGQDVADETESSAADDEVTSEKAKGETKDDSASTSSDRPAASGRDLRCQFDPTLPLRNDYARQGSYQVGTLNAVFVDRSRSIPAKEKRQAAPARRLVTTIYYPTPAAAAAASGKAPVAAGGPFPMIMYSHGFSSNRSEGKHVAERAASYGYVVVAPDFPLTNLLAPGGPDTSDGPNQPRDVSFLIDQVLALAKKPGHVLANAIDADRIGAAGVSFGGMTTLLITFHPKLQDPRIKAAAPMAALSSFFAEGFYHTREVPTLIVHGDQDAMVRYESNALVAFKRAAPNARLLTIRKGTHSAFAVQLPGLLNVTLNGVMGLPNSNPNNPDGFGCGAMRKALEKDKESSFVEALGGPENFIDDSGKPPATACPGDEYTKPALNPAKQIQVTVPAVVAFFDAHLAKTREQRSDGCRYLLEVVPKDRNLTLQ